jgi:hypothetical protein
MMPRLVYRPVYLGIDPGASGGVAALVGGDVWFAVKMPETDRDVIAVIEKVAERPGQKYCLIEKVGGYLKGRPAPGSRMFNFGRGYGAVCMCLACHLIPFEECPPRRWQKKLEIPPKHKEERDRDWKRRLRQRAQQMFPTANATLATADALLIAEACRRTKEVVE